MFPVNNFYVFVVLLFQSVIFQVFDPIWCANNLGYSKGKQWFSDSVNQTSGGQKTNYFISRCDPPKHRFFQQQRIKYLPSGKRQRWLRCCFPYKRGDWKSSYLRKVRRQRWYCNVIPSQERSNKSLLDFNSVDYIILISIFITWSSYYISNSMWCLLSHGTQHRIRHFMLSKHCKIQNTISCKLHSAQQNISNLWCKNYSTNGTHYLPTINSTHPSFERFCKTEVALPSLKGPAHSILYMLVSILLCPSLADHSGTKDPCHWGTLFPTNGGVAKNSSRVKTARADPPHRQVNPQTPIMSGKSRRGRGEGWW